MAVLHYSGCVFSALLPWLLLNVLMRESGQLEKALFPDYKKGIKQAASQPHPKQPQPQAADFAGLPWLWNACAQHWPLLTADSSAGWTLELGGGQDASRSLGLWEENNREGPSQKVQGKASSGNKERQSGPDLPPRLFTVHVAQPRFHVRLHFWNQMFSETVIEKKKSRPRNMLVCLQFCATVDVRG